MLRKLSDIVERNGRWHKRWEDRLCSLIGINIIKINFIQDNLQIQCNHYQNSNGYLYRTRMNDSKFVGKRKRSWTAKITLRKNLTEGIILPDYIPSYTPRYSKQNSMVYYHKNQHITQWTGMESPEMHPYISN